MGERVLLLGAGASYGAREGLGNQINDEALPPLGRNLGQYLLRWLAANDPARQPRPFMAGYHWPASRTCPHYAGKHLWTSEHLGDVRNALEAVAAEERAGARSTTPFEILMDKWSRSDDGQDLLTTVHRVLAYSMLVGYRCGFSECPDRFDELIVRFGPTMVVTLNYDTLLEEALRRRSLGYSYPHMTGSRVSNQDSTDHVSEGAGGIVPVFKPHGSANWVSMHSGAVGVDEARVKEMANDRPTRMVQSGPFLTSQTWDTYDPPNRFSLLYELEAGPITGEIVIAVYGTGKHVLHNPEHVQQHRAACIKRLGEAEIDSVLAVGIRPVTEDDDALIDELIRLLANRPGGKLYVSPSDLECAEMRRRGFVARRATLAEYLLT